MAVPTLLSHGVPNWNKVSSTLGGSVAPILALRDELSCHYVSEAAANGQSLSKPHYLYEV